MRRFSVVCQILFCLRSVSRALWARYVICIRLLETESWLCEAGVAHFDITVKLVDREHGVVGTPVGGETQIQ